MMSQTSRQTRKDNAINYRIDKNTTKINTVENNVNKLQKDFNEHILRHVLDDLQEERFPGSNKSMYSYQDIADRYHTSSSTVCRIANDNGLERRNNKIN